jgi:hypothetical protein
MAKHVFTSSNTRYASASCQLVIGRVDLIPPKRVAGPHLDTPSSSTSFYSTQAVPYDTPAYTSYIVESCMEVRREPLLFQIHGTYWACKDVPHAKDRFSIRGGKAHSSAPPLLFLSLLFSLARGTAPTFRMAKSDVIQHAIRETDRLPHQDDLVCLGGANAPRRDSAD